MSNALVIIPTYNEKENIVMMIETVFALPKDFHILVVDDGSPDGTADSVKELQYGMEHGYEFLLEMDADFSHDPKDLVHLYLECSEYGHDLSIGSRYATGVNVVNWPMGRVLMSYFASAYVRMITGMPIQDTTAGFVCYRRKVLETIELDKIRFVGYAFQIEMKFLAWKYGFKLKEVPIIFTERTRGVSKMSSGIFKEALFGVIQMTVTSWFKKYIPN